MMQTTHRKHLCGKLRRLRTFSVLRPSSCALPPAPCTLHPAFTLVELLVAITIMGILSSIALFALASVQESAKGDKTRATIAKLNALVMAKYESYRTRRVPVDVKAVAAYRNYAANNLGWAEARVDVLRELMRMELPDRFTDIIDNPVTAWTDATTGKPDYMQRPSASVAYLAALPATRSTFAEGAKCLYLFVSHGTDNPDVMQLFGQDEIATDTDGMNYFVDGWGQPIFLQRWAPGFTSPLQPWNVNPTDALGNANTNKIYPTTHDPLDPLQMYRPTTGDLFYNPTLPANEQIYPPLYPLIFSCGPDQIADIFLEGTDPVSGSPNFHYSTTSPPNNPFAVVVGGLFGAPTDLPNGNDPKNLIDNSVDNITNHDMSENQ